MRYAVAVAVLGLAVLPVRADDDDLALVKRAVASDERPGAHRSGARWFRVRIEERDGGKVKVNLPLPFVRAIGEKSGDWPGGVHCGREGSGACKLKLSDVLEALDAGQEFVSVEDDEGTIRIWID